MFPFKTVHYARPTLQNVIIVFDLVL